MQKKRLIDDKTAFILAASVVAVYALATVALYASGFVNYDIKGLYSRNDLDKARKDLAMAETHKSDVYDRLLIDNNFADVLYMDTRHSKLLEQYMNLTDKMRDANNNDKNLWTEYYELGEAMALREDSLMRQYIETHPDMIKASKLEKQARSHFDKVMKDCATRDSLKQVPLVKRIKSNWQKFCADRQR